MSTEVASNGNAHTVEDVPNVEVSGPVQEPRKLSEEALPHATPNFPTVPSAGYRKPPKSDLSVVRLIEKAEHSAGKLVNLLVKHFPSFRDEARFDGKRVRLLKRAQIFVADLWAAFNGTGYGEFKDIGEITIFAGKPWTANTRL